MTNIASSSFALLDNAIDELFTFGNLVIDNTMGQILLLFLMSVIFGMIWMGARRFLGTR